jgi:serine/threonine protein kinase
MPAPTKTDDFLDLVRKSGLVSPDELETFSQQVNADEITPKKTASMLVGAGLVTYFQAEQFLLGKWRGFTIGKYKVLERLGFGGTGTVYLCEHLQVHRKVAVKVLPITKSDNPAALGRFYREARAAGILEHPNLVKCHDVDQDNGLHFLVMDYVDGSSLQHIIGKFGPMAVERAAGYMRQAALGLQAAHQAGLVHRDIKPANILVDRRGVVRVLDLGLARFFEDDQDLLTLKYDEKNVLGTADYVAPEQALNSHAVDIRADIYSLGATFYFLLAGKPPFPEGKAAQKLVYHQVRQPQSIRDLRKEVPEGLAAIVHKMLAKKPGERFQTPAELVAALDAFVVEALPPPAEEEMPRLCPAARATSTYETDLNNGIHAQGAFRPSSSKMQRTTLAGPTVGNRGDTDIPAKSNRRVSMADLTAPRKPSKHMSDAKRAESQTPTECQTPAPTEALVELQPVAKKPNAKSRTHWWTVGSLLLVLTASAMIGILWHWGSLTLKTAPQATTPPSVMQESGSEK